MLEMKKTGERFIPTQSDVYEIWVNADRYFYALEHCLDKQTRKPRNVLDLGCGSGLGTYLYSLVAGHVTAVDYNEDAFKYAKQYPYEESKVSFLKMDLEKEIPEGKYDVTIALESLEHLSDPGSLI